MLTWNDSWQVTAVVFYSQLTQKGKGTPILVRSRWSLHCLHWWQPESEWKHLRCHHLVQCNLARWSPQKNIKTCNIMITTHCCDWFQVNSADSTINRNNYCTARGKWFPCIDLASIAHSCVGPLVWSLCPSPRRISSRSLSSDSVHPNFCHAGLTIDSPTKPSLSLLKSKIPRQETKGYKLCRQVSEP